MTEKHHKKTKHAAWIKNIAGSRFSELFFSYTWISIKYNESDFDNPRNSRPSLASAITQKKT